jgi:excisionase family DNA binding protein
MKGKDTAKTSMAPINIMTVRELSAYLYVHTSTIYRVLKQRQLPAFQVGSDWRFSIAAIDPWRLQQEEPKCRLLVCVSPRGGYHPKFYRCSFAAMSRP